MNVLIVKTQSYGTSKIPDLHPNPELPGEHGCHDAKSGYHGIHCILPMNKGHSPAIGILNSVCINYLACIGTRIPVLGHSAWNGAQEPVELNSTGSTSSLPWHTSSPPCLCPPQHPPALECLLLTSPSGWWVTSALTSPVPDGLGDHWDHWATDHQPPTSTGPVWMHTGSAQKWADGNLYRYALQHICDSALWQ